ncbi:4Fe-4S dicluster domain-containing protein [Verrucomicrobiota bacterium]
MRLPCLLQLRVLKLALKSLFSRPFTTQFPARPYEPIREFRGAPRYSEEDCIGCGACAEVCPATCIDLVDDTDGSPPVRRLVHHLDACILCGQCVRYCTTEKGIEHSTEFEHVGFAPEDFDDKVEKELLLCEACGCIIAPVAQLRWIARRLGPLVYTNPTLMLVSHGELRVVDDGVRPELDEEAQRFQRVSIQCPKCRRKSVLAV